MSTNAATALIEKINDALNEDGEMIYSRDGEEIDGISYGRFSVFIGDDYDDDGDFCGFTWGLYEYSNDDRDGESKLIGDGFEYADASDLVGMFVDLLTPTPRMSLEDAIIVAETLD